MNSSRAIPLRICAVVQCTTDDHRKLLAQIPQLLFFTRGQGPRPMRMDDLCTLRDALLENEHLDNALWRKGLDHLNSFFLRLGNGCVGLFQSLRHCTLRDAFWRRELNHLNSFFLKLGNGCDALFQNLRYWHIDDVCTLRDALSLSLSLNSSPFSEPVPLFLMISLFLYKKNIYMCVSRNYLSNSCPSRTNLTQIRHKPMKCAMYKRIRRRVCG